ncbi:hypothetical protein [Metabacillus halosaccharovorans]|uniref:Uncharacterized protein n=1 Tax=Metabacillus halosaccharovorans TaxID=930124 RepID=A0ABT3DIN3_9BACI|nr:hypothetical protein [Metabacillus halosaccharovorans]MCV9886918.1 hypothetical protein [Metabacillus halosaccharovorans]
MDDKLFEEQMKNLKNSYDQMSTISSVGKIVGEVKKAEKPYKRKVKLTLPYVASFIGVLFIAGLLATQLLTQPEKTGTNSPPSKNTTENQPVTANDIETAMNEIRGYYERKVDELEEKLGFQDVEQYAFVQEAKEAVQKFEERRSYKTQTELKNYSDNVKQIIDLRVSLPNEEFELIRTMTEDNQVSNEEIIKYIEKLEYLKERYTEKWQKVYEENQAEVTNISEYVEKLNSPDFSSDSKEYVDLVEEMKRMGYIFIDGGEGTIYFKIDYTNISEAFNGQMSKEVEGYLDIQQGAKIASDGALIITRKELEERIILLEGIILKNPNFKDLNEVKSLYQLWVQYYLTGLNNTPIENEQGYIEDETLNEFDRFISAYPNSEASKIVQSFLNKLRDQNNQLTDELKQEVETLIPSNLKVVPNGLSVNLLPLTDQMMETYEAYKQSENNQLLDGPFAGNNTIDLVVARMYMYALVKEDYEMAYILTYKGPGSDVPTLEQFTSEIKGAELNIQKLSNEVKMVNWTYTQDGERVEHTYIKQNGETAKFKLQLEGGVPKVEYRSLF